MMSVAFTRKTGDTLRIRGRYRDANGDFVNLTTAGIAIRSTIRSTEAERSFQTVVLDQDANRGAFILVMETEGLPPGDYDWDCRYIQAGNNQSTDTATVRLRPGVTA